MTEPDEWRTLHQRLPENVYHRLMEQLRRLARVNGISPEAFNRDSKFEEAIGPRVQVIEILTVLLERTEHEDVLRV